MIRKLILLAITAGLAKKLYDSRAAPKSRSPFPTTANH